MGGKGSIVKPDPEVAKTVLSELTLAPYVVTPPRQYDLSKNPEWYVTCLDGYYYEKTAHADTIWADSGGVVWIESTHLGSPTSWAEEEYGEKGAIRVMDMKIDYRRSSLIQIQARLKDLPKLQNRIRDYRRIAEEVSRKSGVSIGLIFDARADLGWFLFRSRISSKEAGEFENELRKAVAAMKEVYDQTEGAHYRALLKSVDDADSSAT